MENYYIVETLLHAWQRSLPSLAKELASEAATDS
jgi:hypothetical protein